MMMDCAILGGGAAGLSAALVLGRARRSVLLFDDQRPRNAVTQESHGFLTRDSIKPEEFRAIAHQDISKYPSVEFRQIRITDVLNKGEFFELRADNQEVFQARTIILATGLKEELPAIDSIHEYYGKSLFSCPYCDGWELRDQPLVLISEGAHTFHMAKMIWNWSRDLLVCTNGHHALDEAQQEILREQGIKIIEDPIVSLAGEHGQLQRVVFANGDERSCMGGFVATTLSQASPFASQLGCTMNAHSGIVVDQYGRTTIPGVYAAGEAVGGMGSQLILAASEGYRAAAGVNTDWIGKAFRG